MVPVCVFFFFFFFFLGWMRRFYLYLCSVTCGNPIFFWTHLAARYLDGALIIIVLSLSGTGTTNWNRLDVVTIMGSCFRLVCLSVALHCCYMLIVYVAPLLGVNKMN